MKTKRLYSRVPDPRLLPSEIKTPILWTPDAALLAPLIKFDDGFELHYYDKIDIQQIFADIKVPSNYLAGNPITLTEGNVVCESAANNILMKCETTLLRPSTSVFGAYPNKHTSTNAEIILALAYQFEPLGAIDLSDATGKINGINVAANDILRIRIYRDFANETISAIKPARILTNGFVPKFN